MSTTPEPNASALAEVPAAPLEATDAAPRDAAWDDVRACGAAVKIAGRLFLRGQVRLGMMLAAKKKEHQANGGGRGGDRKSMAKNPPLISWAEKVKQETGYSRQSVDEFIRYFEAAKAKLKAHSKALDLPKEAKENALMLFSAENPLTLNDEQWAQVDSVIGTLTDGETQASLMQELGLVPKRAMPNGGKKEEGGPEPTMGQLAFHFFEPVASALINARTSADYKKLIMALPLESTGEHSLSLSTLEAEFRAALADIEEVKQSTARAAKGRVVA